MASLTPAALYGLEVEPGDEPVPAVDLDHYPATFRITMAAIDPTQAPVPDGNAFNGATLKMIVLPPLFDDDEDDDDVDVDDEDLNDNLMKILNGANSGSDEDDDEEDDEEDEDDEDEDDEDESDSDDEDVNGGPSDPEKSPRALKRKQALKIIEDSIAQHNDDDVMDVDGLPNGSGLKKSKKLPPGKGKEKADDEDEDEDEDDEGLPEGSKELVICTLDLAKGYQQPLDIVINKHEQVLFKVSGSLSVHLTGNYLDDDSFDPEDDSMYDEEDDAYDLDLEPDDDELDIPYDEDESDELDDLEIPRIEELDSEDDNEAPKLVKSAKGKNKRSAEDFADDQGKNATTSKQDTLVNGDANLSKKQRKKLKANGGNAVDVVETVGTSSDGSVKTHDVTKTSPGKKVQFAETLVQGPSGSTAKAEDTKKQDANGSKPEQNAKGNAPGLGIKTVQGVKIDDKKLGSGPQAKKGDRVSMRYIGKLEQDKRVFDSNKKGPPFSFKIASGQVIKGWDIGVAGMQAGGERRITVPAHLAYGSKKLPDIPPNSTLVFDLKLLDIK